MFTFGGGRAISLLSMWMLAYQQTLNKNDYSPKTHLKSLQVDSLFIFLSGMKILPRNSIMIR